MGKEIFPVKLCFIIEQGQICRAGVAWLDCPVIMVYVKLCFIIEQEQMCRAGVAWLDCPVIMVYDGGWGDKSRFKLSQRQNLCSCLNIFSY